MLSCASNKKKAPLSSEADLPGHTFITVTGCYYDIKYSQMEGLKAFRVNTEADALQALKKGLGDVLIIDDILFPVEEQQRLGIKMAFTGEDYFSCAYATRKGNVALRDSFNSFLSELRSDGTLGKITDYWINGGPEVPMPPMGEIKDPTPFRVVLAMKSAPMSFYRDGEWTGMDPDILKRFARYLGRPIVFSNMEISSAIMGIQMGQADFMGGCIFVTEERKKNMDFTDPYFNAHTGFFVNDDVSVKSQGLWENIQGSLFVEGRWKLIADGLWATILITILSILLGSILGVGYCLMAMSGNKTVRGIAGVYHYLMQGIPMLVLLLIMFYVVFGSSSLNAIAVAVIAFALNFASSSGGIFQHSVMGVPKGQWEAGLALGFTPFQTFRHFIFPQAVKDGIHAYTGQCVALMQATSIVGYVAIQDITRASDIIRSRTFDAFIPLLVVTVLYFLLAWCIRKTLTLITAKKNDHRS